MFQNPWDMNYLSIHKRFQLVHLYLVLFHQVSQWNFAMLIKDNFAKTSHDELIKRPEGLIHFTGDTQSVKISHTCTDAVTRIIHVRKTSNRQDTNV